MIWKTHHSSSLEPRFSAEMSLLLSILMTVNALGAMLLVPALLSLVPESWWSAHI